MAGQWGRRAALAALLASLVQADPALAPSGAGIPGVRWSLDAFPSVDALSYPTAEGQEELLLFREPGRLARYPLTVPRGYRLRQLGPGAPVELLDPQGRARSRVSAPVAWDATGQQGRPTLEIQGHELVVGPPPGAALPALVDPLWSQAGTMSVARKGHTATVLSDGRVLLAGGQKIEGETPGAERSEVYDPWVNTFTLGPAQEHPRYWHGAVLRGDGKVVLLGGLAAEISPGIPGDGWPSSPPVEIYDPLAETPEAEVRGLFSTPGPAPDFGFVVGPVVALPKDRALVFGGAPGQGKARVASHAYRVDLTTGVHEVAGELQTGRRCFGAALLEDGRVLVVGGEDETGKALESVELFDPTTGKSEATGELPTPRSGCRGGSVGPLDTVVLPSGAVMVLGASDGQGDKLAIYDPKQGKFPGILTRNDPSTIHPLRLDEGDNIPVPQGSGGVFRWFNTPGLISDSSKTIGVACSPLLGSSEQFCSPIFLGEIGELFTSLRERPTATLLPTGAALVAGGATSKVVEIFSERARKALFVSSAHETVISLAMADVQPTLFAWGGSEEGGILLDKDACDTFVLDATSQVMKRIGQGFRTCTSGTPIARASGGELLQLGRGEYDQFFSKFSLPEGLLGVGLKEGDFGGFGVPSTFPFTTFDQNNDLLASAWVTPQIISFGGVVSYDPSVPVMRVRSLLDVSALPGRIGVVWPLGGQKLLVVGGGWGEGLLGPLTSEVVDLSKNKGELLPFSLHVPRFIGHALTELAGGRILVSGGSKFAPGSGGTVLAEAEILDLEAKTSTLVPGGMNHKHSGHTTLRLPSGDILIGDEVPEIFDPKTETFELVKTPGGLKPERHLLPAAGGGALAQAQAQALAQNNFQPTTLLRYDPEKREMVLPPEPTGPLSQGTALARLPGGKMLLLGDSAQLFDPTSGRREPLTFPGAPRLWATATLLSSGQVLVVGGQALGPDGKLTEPLGEAWLFDPATASFSAAGSLEARARHSATVLPSGRVLLAGGQGGGGQVLSSLVEYDPQTGGFSEVGKQKRARWGHGAALLPSGEVLFVGGQPASGAPDGAEVFDLVKRTVRPVGGRKIDTLTQAAALPGGDVLVATPEETLVFRVALESFDASLNALTVGGGTGLAVDLVGEAALCRGPGCYWVGPAFSALSPALAYGKEFPPLAAGARTPQGGVALIFEPLPGTLRSGVYARTPAPASVKKPVLKALVDTEKSGAALLLNVDKIHTFTGERLARPAVVGSTLGPRPETHPLVVWAPENGAAIPARVTAWNDESVSFVLPVTAYTGPGFLHAIVDGVPGEGVFAVVQGKPPGGGCEQAFECASGHCADGVCCNVACKGRCVACSVAARHKGEGLDPEPDGVCATVGVNQPDEVSDEPCEPVLCQQTGLCDGQGACQPVPEASLCALGENKTGVCRSGACNDEPRCDASGLNELAPDGTPTSCLPFVCRDGACLQACAADGDCAGGLKCEEGSCEAFCDGNTAVTATERTPCGATRCQQGKCPQDCRSNRECAEGYVCAEERCVLESAVASGRDPGACAAAPGPPGGVGALALAALAALAARRSGQQRRRRGQTAGDCA